MRRAVVTAAMSVCAIVPGVTALAAPAAAAPDPFTVTFRTSPRFGTCDGFNVLVQATGKARTIEAPDGGVVGVSAATVATATNLKTGTSVQYSINGTFHTTTDANGNVTTTATGKNFLTDPDAGVVVTSGTFTFTFDKKGKLVEGLSGTGQITDVCAALA
jgi:hypothetical protein